MPRVTTWENWVRSTDVDSDGIVNNSVYFQYFEQARLEHLVGLGLGRRGDPDRPAGDHDRLFTLAQTSCTFKAPLRHRDWVTVSCWTSEVRNRSFVLAYEIRMREDPTGLVAEGTSAQVWLDAAGAPTPIPAWFREALTASISR